MHVGMECSLAHRSAPSVRPLPAGVEETLTPSRASDPIVPFVER